MKHIALFLAITLAFTGCASAPVTGTTPTPSVWSKIVSFISSPQTITSAEQVAALAVSTYKATRGKLSTQQIETLASNDLFGAASIAQAYSGSNANVAIAATGAKDAAAMAQVVAQLPGGKITPDNISLLLDAAAKLAQTQP